MPYMEIKCHNVHDVRMEVAKANINKIYFWKKIVETGTKKKFKECYHLHTCHVVSTVVLEH